MPTRKQSKKATVKVVEERKTPKRGKQQQPSLPEPSRKSARIKVKTGPSDPPIIVEDVEEKLQNEVDNEVVIPMESLIEVTGEEATAVSESHNDAGITTLDIPPGIIVIKALQENLQKATGTSAVTTSTENTATNKRRSTRKKNKQQGKTTKSSKATTSTSTVRPSKVTKVVLTNGTTHEKKTYQCAECGKVFPDIKKLAEHEVADSHVGFRCVVCEKVFTRKYHLERHLQLTPCSGQPPPAHPCEVCGKVYTRKDNLREHLRVHAGEETRKKKFQCQYCPKKLHGASLLKIHERTHTGEKPFQCDMCPKAFPSGGALTKHRRIHTGEKPYACPMCDIRFSLKGTLNRHMRIHTGIRPHKCPHCDKQFIQAGGLKAHMFYHTGQNGFKCEFCDKEFNRKARLQMHIRYVHEKDRPFECDACQKCFTRKEDLNRHAVLHTGEKPHQCPQCKKTFAIKPSLKLHMLTHTKEEPRSCHDCGRAFIRRDCLLRHMRKKHRDNLPKLMEELEKETVLNPLGLLNSVPSMSGPMTNEKLIESIRELLTVLVDESTLEGFGWPDAPIDQLLESVIKRCGHNPVDPDKYEYYDRLRENCKLLFTVVIDDNAVKTLLNNQTVDEVILHVLRLAS